MSDLGTLLEEHRSDPFPDSIEKGVDYGSVDPVMIDADIYGWALGVAGGGHLSPTDRGRLLAAREGLAQSLLTFPEDAQLYYARLLAIADKALA